MKVSIIQCKLNFGNVDENFELIEKNIEQAAKDKPDVLVLPEMWNTSFIPKDIKEIADKDSVRTKNFLQSVSKKYNVNIVGGSVSNLRNDKLYNTSYIYGRDGNLIAQYDKVHLFSPSDEDKIFEKGNKLVTFEIDGVKCGIVICYDIRFVEWIRKYALNDIKILFVPAAWPKIRSLHWDTLNRARAIENQMVVVNVNSLGKSDSGDFGGHSSIIDPWGEYIVKPDEKVGIKVGDIDLEVIKDIRASINVFNDRRKDLY